MHSFTDSNEFRLPLIPFFTFPCQEFYDDVGEETEKIEKELDLSQELLKDNLALALLRLEERIEQVLVYIKKLSTAISEINREVAHDKEFAKDLESILARVREVPSRVKSWKKSAARAGADISLTLVRIHCKGVDEKKLKSLEIAKKKHAKLEDFM